MIRLFSQNLLSKIQSPKRRIKQFVRNLLYFCLFYTGSSYLLQMIIPVFLGSGIRILCLHRIINDHDIYSWRRYNDQITRSEFGRLIKHLKKHYKIISLEECVQLLMADRRLPGRYIAITIDDGYADSFHNAYPILSQYRVPATFFITTGVIGTGDSLWFQRVYNIFLRTSLESVTVDWLGKTLVWDRDMRARVKAMKEVTESLKMVSPEEREKRIDSIYELLMVTTDKPHELDRMLSWEELIEMTKDPLISIGSHSVTHSTLSSISEKSDAWREIYESAYTIKRELGYWPRFFSYPNGNSSDFNELHEQLIEEAGFIGACTVINGLNNNHGTSIYRLRRMCVSRDAFYRIALNIAGLEDFITFVKNKYLGRNVPPSKQETKMADYQATTG